MSNKNRKRGRLHIYRPPVSRATMLKRRCIELFKQTLGPKIVIFGEKQNKQNKLTAICSELIVLPPLIGQSTFMSYKMSCSVLHEDIWNNGVQRFKFRYTTVVFGVCLMSSEMESSDEEVQPQRLHYSQKA
ncbi:hypothetical protein C0J52_14868 [Blattella germanica]|nr:hypothetical protein C0J52_14868 [Blattella germanica]